MTIKLKNYSTTPGSNNSAAPDGWPEGMLPSDVNNCAREGMARLREWYVDSEWIDHGHTIVSSTGSTIVVSGDQTAIYTAGRGIRTNQSATLKGWVTSSTYGAPNTTINVTGFTVAAPTQVEVGAVTSQYSLPNNMSLTVAALTVPSFTTTTQSPGNNSTLAATTEYADAAATAAAVALGLTTSATNRIKIGGIVAAWGDHTHSVTGTADTITFSSLVTFDDEDYFVGVSITDNLGAASVTINAPEITKATTNFIMGFDVNVANTLAYKWTWFVIGKGSYA